MATKLQQFRAKEASELQTNIAKHVNYAAAEFLPDHFEDRSIYQIDTIFTSWKS